MLSINFMASLQQLEVQQFTKSKRQLFLVLHAVYWVFWSLV